MEHSVSSLAYKGSITEAILEAKRQKKLFVVYMSGDNVESNNLEKSTWTDSSLAETLSKYCILLHISEGSVDAAQFSAIFPQRSAPCITVIGYNGLQLWQNGGFITAEVLASSFEKAWLNLHIQETTAGVLTAALTAKKTEQLASGASSSNSSGQGNSTGSNVQSPSTDRDVHSSQVITSTSSAKLDYNEHSKHDIKEPNAEVGDDVFPAPEIEAISDHVEQSSASTLHESLDCMKSDPEHIAVVQLSENDEFANSVQKEKSVHPKSGANETTSQVVRIEATETVQAEAFGEVKNEDFSASKSDNVHLNIRLPDYSSLQEKFLLTSTLRDVKDCVDKKQGSSLRSYDLAIPYPRKVFISEDLSKTLSELGLVDRQALIVVPHSGAIGYLREVSSSCNQTSTSHEISGSGEGYFSFVKKIISYVNPLSYLGGGGTDSASSLHESQRGPNSALQNNVRGPGRLNFAQSNQSAAPATSGTRKRPTSSRIGSNIHTLNHDEDDRHQSSDRNTFWNGNSTQYGGDDNDGK